MEYNQFGIEPSSMKRTYQLLASLDAGENDLEISFQETSKLIYRWVRNKFNITFRNYLPRDLQTFSKEQNGIFVGVIYLPDQKKFVVRTLHPDTGVPGRIWITEAGIYGVNNRLTLGIKNSCSSLYSCQIPAPFSVPGFVWKRANRAGIKDTKKLSETPWVIYTDDDIAQLKDLIENPERKLPVVVISQTDKSKWIYPSICSDYLVNENSLTKNVYVYAHIVLMPFEISYKWTDMVGKQWSVFDGAIRTYYPNLKFEGDDPYRHPLCIKDKILASSFVDEKGTEYTEGEAFEHILLFSLQRYNTKEHLLWPEYGVESYFALNRSILTEQRNSPLNSIEELKALYENEINHLNDQLTEWQQLASSCDIDCISKDDTIQELKSQLNDVNKYNGTLRTQISQRTGQDVDSQIPIPNTYDGINEWIKEHLAGRLILHQRAIRSLKDAIFVDVELVYKALKLLAIDYRDMRKGLITRQEFDNRCSELNIQEKAAISEVGAGEHGDDYFVTYNEKKLKLDRHLMKGVNRDRRYCMRIYFFWDDEDEAVVVGDLPDHLTVSIS